MLKGLFPLKGFREGESKGRYSQHPGPEPGKVSRNATQLTAGAWDKKERRLRRAGLGAASGAGGAEQELERRGLWEVRADSGGGQSLSGQSPLGLSTTPPT